MSEQVNQTTDPTSTGQAPNTSTTPAAGETLRQAQGETPQPLTWDAWHSSLSDDQRKLVDARFSEDTKGLKGALDKERDESKHLAKQISSLQEKYAEKGSELEKALTDLQAQLAAAIHEKQFILDGPAKGVSNIKAAYKLAVADGLIDKGEVDWDALKGSYPELFVQPKPAAPPPNTNATSTSKGVEKNYGGLSLTEVAQRYGIRAN